MSILDNFFPNKFSTIFEVDYDTPYRYFVGQDSTVLATTQLAPHAHASPFAPSTPNTPLSPVAEEFSPGSANGLINDAFEDEESACKEYGTIINGKRAVSLKNFGKFAQKEAGRRKQLSYMQR